MTARRQPAPGVSRNWAGQCTVNAVLVGERQIFDRTLVGAIRAHIGDHPEAVAIEHPGGLVTYRELWDRSTRLATLIVEARDSDRPLAVWADRTPDVIATMLACLRTATTYVPVDPTYPPARVATILETADPSALLADPAGRGVPPGLRTRVIHTTEADERRRPVPDRDAAPHAAAYVMFTSGSTGRPKPVAISAAALLNYCSWVNGLAPRGCGSPVFGSLAFDHSITLIWPNLMTGKRIVLLPGPWDLTLLLRERDEPFSLLKATPSHLRMFERLARPDYARLTHILMFGGESLTGDLVTQLRPRLSGVTLVNHFGPTECTVGCVAHVFDANDVDDPGPVPIGRPVWNTTAYVLSVDDDDAAAEVGELAIGGVQVCLPTDGDTRERFPDEAEWGGPPGRAYRTGDLVSMQADGALVYRGRRDDQLKVNAVRLEAQEVRTIAKRVPGVVDAVAWASASQMQRLRVEVAAGHLGEADRSALALAVSNRLRAELPPAIALGSVTVVESLRVNAHGKAVRSCADGP